MKRRRTQQRSPVTVTRDRTIEPRLPHERDESADSQVPADAQQRAAGRKALRDIEAGRVDTDVGPVLEEISRTQLPSAHESAPRKRKRSR